MKKRKGKEDKAEVYIRKTKAFPEVLRRLLFVSWVNLLHTANPAARESDDKFVGLILIVEKSQTKEGWVSLSTTWSHTSGSQGSGSKPTLQPLPTALVVCGLWKVYPREDRPHSKSRGCRGGPMDSQHRQRTWPQTPKAAEDSCPDLCLEQGWPALLQCPGDK